MQLLIPTILGAESVVRDELWNLGYRETELNNGQIFLSGAWEDIQKLNSSIRTAERVQIIIGSFHARNFDDVFDQVKQLPIADFLQADARVVVTAKSKRSILKSEVSLQRCVKKALVENIKQSFEVTEVTESGPTFPIQLSIFEEKALLLLDTTGEGLHRRGYREEAGTAPLKETLAATLIYLSGWDWNSPLYDPCCGSGTILIEAAEMAANLQAGRRREFLYTSWESAPHLSPHESLALEEINFQISGSDIDPKIIQTATRNAGLAEVQNLINFTTTALKDADFKDGTILSNPPYGERLKGDLKGLYRDFARLLKQNRSLHLLTSDKDVEKFIGRPASKRRKLSNGGMEVSLYSWHN